MLLTMGFLVDGEAQTEQVHVSFVRVSPGANNELWLVYEECDTPIPEVHVRLSDLVSFSVWPVL